MPAGDNSLRGARRSSGHGRICEKSSRWSPAIVRGIARSRTSSAEINDSNRRFMLHNGRKKLWPRWQGEAEPNTNIAELYRRTPSPCERQWEKPCWRKWPPIRAKGWGCNPRAALAEGRPHDSERKRKHGGDEGRHHPLAEKCERSRRTGGEGHHHRTGVQAGENQNRARVHPIRNRAGLERRTSSGDE